MVRTQRTGPRYQAPPLPPHSCLAAAALCTPPLPKLLKGIPPVTPDQLLYAKTHEWVYVDRAGSDKIATVGISSFAVEALTDLVYIELPEVGRQVTAGMVRRNRIRSRR